MLRTHQVDVQYIKGTTRRLASLIILAANSGAAMKRAEQWLAEQTDYPVVTLNVRPLPGSNPPPGAFHVAKDAPIQTVTPSGRDCRLVVAVLAKVRRT